MAPVSHPANGNGALPSPYVELDRAAWARLRENQPLSLDAADLARLQGLGDRIDLAEVEEVYLPAVPAAQLLRRAPPPGCTASPATSSASARPRRRSSSASPGRWRSASPPPPACSRSCCPAGPGTPEVELVTTDGFLYPNAELERRNLLQRKGFPESYNRRALLRFVAEVKSGKAEVSAPVYSHLTYDIVPGERIVVRQPDVLIVEGLNVLQAPRLQEDGRTGLAVSDFFDFSVYVDAHLDDIRQWYVERFLRLRETAFADPALLLPPLCRAVRRAGPRHRRPHLGARSTRSTCARTSCPPAAAPPWCSPRARTTASAGSGCASSEARYAAWSAAACLPRARGA